MDRDKKELELRKQLEEIEKQKEKETRQREYDERHRHLTDKEVAKNRDDYILDLVHRITTDCADVALNSYNESIDRYEYKADIEKAVRDVIEFREQEYYTKAAIGTDGTGQTDKSYDEVAKIRPRFKAYALAEAKRKREEYNSWYNSSEQRRKREASRNFDRRWSYSAQDYRDWENSKDSLN